MKMQDELKRIMEHKEMVTIYGDSADYDYHFVGYIQAIDESGLLLSKQNYSGYPSGFVFFTDVIYFETDTKDTRRHEKLYQLRGLQPAVFPVNAGQNLLEEVLRICCEKRLFCNIFKKEDDEGDELGFISELHEDHLIFTNIDKYGDYFGKSYFAKSDIFRIFIEGEVEQTTRLLYDAQHNT